MSASSSRQHANLKRRIYRRDSGQCRYCFVPLTIEGATLDHHKPKSLGGNSNAENLRLCCGLCNGLKRDMTPAQWLAYREGSAS